MSNIRLNWVAILVAAIASFIFEALWFSAFMTGWLEGIGRTKEWLLASGMNPAVQYVIAILCSIIAAAVLSICIQTSGKQTARRGVLCAVVIWFGFIATSWAKAYIFEVRTLKIYAIYNGYYLIDLILMGAIVGARKKKPEARPQTQ
jgi:energy-converting hydrogenase Eha subunit A